MEIIEPEIPSFDVFREEIKKIYPEGDLNRSFNRILWHIENDKFCADGTPITYRLIMDKFAAHIKQWNMKYGIRNPKFLGRAEEEKKKDLYEFIGLKMYEREFVSSAGQGERDKYLFGPFDRKYLMEQIQNFKKKFPNETENIQD